MLSFNLVYVTEHMLPILNPFVSTAESERRARSKVTDRILVKQISLMFLKYVRTEYY